MSIKQAIEALEVAQDALDISQSLQESAKSNHHPKTLAAYERVSAALAALRSMPQGEPVATIRYERGTPGKENDMPKVVSCNWLPDGVYSVYATPPPAPVLLSDAWQPIETAPKDGTAILVSEGRFIHCVEWNDEYEWWAVDDNKLGPFRLRGTAPTHWMPLPPPPIEQAIGRASREAK